MEVWLSGFAPVYREVEACNKVLLGSELPPPSSSSSSVSVGKNSRDITIISLALAQVSVSPRFDP